MYIKLFNYLRTTFNPKQVNSDEMFYNHMESQSGQCLPHIYKPFDINNSIHWSDRGRMFDFLSSIDAQGKEILDFGPGDGWPSLILAPYVKSITGVEGSEKRVSICRQNAERIGITNAEFVFCEPGSALPFADNTFEGACAASSIEQTPDPEFTIHELYRVLKPGAKLRLRYEDLTRYKNGREIDYFIMAKANNTSRLIVYLRDISLNICHHFGFDIKQDKDSLKAGLKQGVSIDIIEDLKPNIVSASYMKLYHPDCKDYIDIALKAGFSLALPTHDGGKLALAYFHSGQFNPGTLDELDEILRTPVEYIAHLQAPIGINPILTLIK